MTEDQLQAVLARWFAKTGYFVDEGVVLDSGNKLDLRAESPEAIWLVECKGDYDRDTAQYSVNFDTAVGQLLKGISRLDARTKYAIAIPFSRTERGERLSYRSILPKYSRSIAFETLNIHLLLVRDDGSVQTIVPGEIRKFLASVSPQIRSR